MLSLLYCLAMCVPLMPLMLFYCSGLISYPVVSMCYSAFVGAFFGLSQCAFADIVVRAWLVLIPLAVCGGIIFCRHRVILFRCRAKGSLGANADWPSLVFCRLFSAIFLFFHADCPIGSAG